ncbi:MAG: Asp-tRNA(Asn)/Glu-tRNA(Gln) amidotransferase subunit GatB [Patescibacteria group bacterium]|jgi:aspartyl-tRNA(Asn)/glutamyl-tRNA(Gln) amidotransferase subunit B
MDKLVPTIGLEIHVQLATKSKMFCRCDNNAEGKAPNTVVCPVCMGFPGTLPVTNVVAVEWGAKAALALGCQINAFQRFDRKNYFYPDLPKGYQISQFFFPVGENGKITIDYLPETGQDKAEFTTRIKRVHLEEDAGKLVHAKDSTLVDFNRCGTPLLEIVTEPDIHSPREAKAFIQELQRIVRALGISQADMEKGHLRVDANISMAPIGSKTLGTLVELKNMNSFRFVEKALDYEVNRQTEVIQGGGKIIKETRGWDEKNNTTLAQRSKEEFNDYRYFPEPDLPPIVLMELDIKKWQTELVNLPAALRQAAAEKGLSYGRTVELQEAGQLARLINLLQVDDINSTLAANWIAKTWTDDNQLINFLQTIEQHSLSTGEANQLYGLANKSGQLPGELVGQIEKIDTATIEKAVAEVLAVHPEAVVEYKAGEKKVVGFLMGQIMAQLHGKGDAGSIKSVLEAKLTE